jgi:STE24 endopeptidase
MNTWLILVITLLCAVAALDSLADALNVRAMRTELPGEFAGTYDPDKYRRSLQYQKDNERASLVRRLVSLAALLIFLLAGGFNAVDLWARSFALGSIATGLIFVAALSALKGLLALPFSIHSTFVIEERYGFNRTTPKTFVSDLLKGIVVGALLGAPVFAAIQWFFENAGPRAWIWSWAGVTAFQLLVVFLAPVVLMPLFNKFNPLPDGALKSAIEQYVHRERFALQGVYTMDGSKRSTKANAYFTGFGRFRRLVLFDTLIEKQTVEELTAVVAHEIGHFKRGHILKSMALSIGVSAALFYAFSVMLENPGLFAAFKMEHVSVYASLVFVAMLYGPLLRPLSVLTQLMSRVFEFEADEYSARTYRKPEELVSALKKLSMDNLSNLTPHPLKVWLDYTHPPVLERIRVLRERREGGAA